MPPSDPRQRLLRLASQLGFFASVAIVFTCGWLAMRTSDWRKILLLTAFAAVAGIVASGFSRRVR